MGSHGVPVLSLYSLGIGADIKGAKGLRLPFLLVEVCCWCLTGLSESNRAMTR